MTDKTERATRGAMAQRSMAIQTRLLDDAARTVELAFSSETPVERWYGNEVLSHSSGAVRLNRINDGAALLRNHDSDQHIGVVESARIDQDGVGRAVVRFSSRTARAEEAWQEVQDGVLRHVSVGYLIHEIMETERKGQPLEVRITDWEPLEVSLVSVPADASVGIGRSLITGITEADTMTTETPKGDDDIRAPAGVAGTDDQVAIRSDEINRDDINKEIRGIGKRYGLSEQAESLIDLHGSVDEMREAARQSIKTRVHAPMPSSISMPDGGRVSGGMSRYKKLRAFKEAGEETAYEMGMWSRAVLFGDQRAALWCKDHNVRVQTTSSISKGGAIVPDEMAQAIIDLRESFGVIRTLARVVPMSSDTMTVPRRVSGVTAYFTGQEAATTESDKAWDQVQLVAREMSALTRFSMSYAEDAVIDVAEDLAREMAYAFAEKEDDCAINGDGTSTYGGITGMRVKLLLSANAGSIVTAASGVDTYAEMDSADLDAVRAILPEYAAMNAKWLMSKPGKNLVIDPILSAAGGNTKEDIGGRLVDSYLGDPVLVSQKMPTSTGDLSDLIMALYGDFESACTIGDRRGFDLQILTERYAEFRQVGVLGSTRFDFVAHDLGTASVAGPVVGFKGN